MSLITVFSGSRTEPAEYRPTDPVRCVICGWEGDAEANAGEYHILSGIPASYTWAHDDDAVCHDCSLWCASCGEDLLDDGDFLGVVADGELLCETCAGEALCPEYAPDPNRPPTGRWGRQDSTIGEALDALWPCPSGASRT
jgi:hypothetical protein